MKPQYVQVGMLLVCYEYECLHVVMCVHTCVEYICMHMCVETPK